LFDNYIMQEDDEETLDRDEKFAQWFKEHIQSNDCNEHLKVLARGPMRYVESHKDQNECRMLLRLLWMDQTLVNIPVDPVGLSSRDLQKSFTRSDTSRTQPIQKGQSYNWLQNEENRNSFSFCQSPVTVINHGEEDDQEDTHEIDDAQTETDTSDDELEENIGSTSQLLENSNYDEGCDNMEQAMQKQLASQHKNKQYKLHLHFKKYPTKEAAMMHPPDGVRTRDWVNLCDRFSSEAFQKISAKNKKNRSFNKVPPAVGSLSVARRVYMVDPHGSEGYLKMVVEVPDSSWLTRSIATCSYPTDKHKDIMKAQFPNQQIQSKRYKHVGIRSASYKDGKVTRLAKRLVLVDYLKLLQRYNVKYKFKEQAQSRSQ
ncbi:hypothetical protein Tco_1083550, partial [Tanacetum coccineum]